jgi:hypothetical protein
MEILSPNEVSDIHASGDEMMGIQSYSWIDRPLHIPPPPSGNTSLEGRDEQRPCVAILRKVGYIGGNNVKAGGGVPLHLYYSLHVGIPTLILSRDVPLDPCICAIARKKLLWLG